MDKKILRALIREIIQEDVGEVTVTKGPRSSTKSGGIASRAFTAVSSFLFGDVDESNFDEEILDEDEEDECDR